jgi:hypothetical protein
VQERSAFSLFDVSERTEAVVFQLEDVFGVVEGLGDAEAHGMDSREHGCILN